MFNATEGQIILSTGVIGALLVMLAGAAVPMIEGALPAETPEPIMGAIALVKAHAAAPVASFLLVTLIVMAALYARSRAEPVFATVRRSLPM